MRGHNRNIAPAIPAQLAIHCRKTPERSAWLESLPATLRHLEREWCLTLHAPFDSDDVTCSWIAPVTLDDGTFAVLKFGMPHIEGEHEIAGLRFWNGDPTVELLRADEDAGAMLLERCVPGTPLRAEPEIEQDGIIAGLLRRLWRLPPEPHPFRPLSMLMEHWTRETLASAGRWGDPGLVEEGLRLFEDLPRTAPVHVLLATDLHAGNVLRARREPWLVIDPKPFFGDPAYDATQHLFNCTGRLRSDPHGVISRFADLLGVDSERVRLWAFARAAAGPRDDWANSGLTEIARALAP